jgi:trans-aconitate 2-methyltransferase
MTAGWDPTQYLAFSDLRLRPAAELLARVRHDGPGLIYDLGCGTGHITRLLCRRWPDAELVGLDSSQAMLDRALQSQDEGSRITWQREDIAAWRASRPADIIYSNAALHWLDAHETLFPDLHGQLAPGGVLAVQMPLSWHLPSHRLMREVLEHGSEHGGPLGDAALRARYARPPVAQPADYYTWLAPHAAHIDIWITEYLQILQGADAVLEWVKGTGLRPILDGLAGNERDRFMDVYRQRLAEAYPVRAGGETLYPFQRLFIVATAPPGPP